ncbi:MAG: DUF4199 family protein [Ignavibacteriales bacterium]|nr:DUF4199 family protein [Ignavibacteriales bacterium]
MKKVLPALVCGFAAGVLQVVPFIRGLSCCLLLPLAGVFAIVLYQKSSGVIEKIPYGKGAMLGLLTGVFAALFSTFFDSIISFITHSNIFVEEFVSIQKAFNDLPFSEEMKNELIKMYSMIRDEIVRDGFSFWYTSGMLVSNLIAGILFGLLGGLLGTYFMNAKNSNYYSSR